MSDFEARARKVLPPVLGHYTWLAIERGEGSWLVTTDGRRVLDMTSGIAVTNVGHSHPRVVKAVVASCTSPPVWPSTNRASLLRR
jgi:4-aminobutyrate aminotransferase